MVLWVLPRRGAAEVVGGRGRHHDSPLHALGRLLLNLLCLRGTRGRREGAGKLTDVGNAKRDEFREPLPHHTERDKAPCLSAHFCRDFVGDFSSSVFFFFQFCQQKTTETRSRTKMAGVIKQGFNRKALRAEHRLGVQCGHAASVAGVEQGAQGRGLAGGRCPLPKQRCTKTGFFC